MLQLGQQYKAAGPIVEDIAVFQPSSAGANSATNPLNQFRQDQIYSIPQQDETYVMFDGYKIYTGAVWPFCDRTVPLDNKDWLLDMFDATEAPGVGAALFVLHKEHKMMDYIAHYLANPAFKKELGEQLKTTLKGFIVGKARNDIIYRYQRLLQTYPIMFETMEWLDEFRKDQIGIKLFRFGIPNAFNFIKPENVTAEMIHEAITNSKATESKRLVPPSDHQYVLMYQTLLAYNGAALVEPAELVRIMMLDWKLGYQFIRAKELDFNTALSIVMTVIYKRGIAFPTFENYSLVDFIYTEYGPSDQWPRIENVIAYVNATTSNRAVLPRKPAPEQQSQPTSSLAAVGGNKFD